MQSILLQFNEIPQIGFAHHFYMENYLQTHDTPEQSFELVYVKSGSIRAQIGDTVHEIAPGSLFLLFRHSPYHLSSLNGEPQSHCSVQLFTDYTVRFVSDNNPLPASFPGLTLPLILPPGPETELLKKELFSIVSDLGISREQSHFCASLRALSVLSKLDALYRTRLPVRKDTASYWEYRIKKYITEHIHTNIPLEQLASALGKTPNYLNYVFKSSVGISIHQYINREKMRLVAEFMESRNLPFEIACENVSVTDLSHGYRLFKKHMGVTPSAYLAGKRTVDSLEK